MNVSAQEVPANDEPEALLARGMKLPPQPAALFALQRLAEREEPDIRDIAEVISRDPALTAGLYRMARSPLFARRVPAQTVEQIILMMGVPRTLVLAQALCVQSAMPGNARALARFWARSTAIAQLAMLVAELQPGPRRVASEQAFLVGMFHDCGVPILMQRFPAYCNRTGLGGMANTWADVCTEDRLFSADHSVIGFLLARHWRLPDFVAQAVRFHHEGSQTLSRPVDAMVAVVQLAMHLYTVEMDLVGGAEGFDEDEVGSTLELDPRELSELSEQVVEDFHNLEH